MEEQRRAAVIRQSGATPTLDQFTDPQPGQGLSVGTLVAAALNPLHVAITNDQFPFRWLQPPCVAGLGSGRATRRRHPPLPGPARPAPYGTLADLVPVPDAAAIPVPPGLAAALGVAGMAGWVALDYRGHLRPGETVLILGAGGTAGQLAVQAVARPRAGLRDVDLPAIARPAARRRARFVVTTSRCSRSTALTMPATALPASGQRAIRSGSSTASSASSSAWAPSRSRMVDAAWRAFWRVRRRPTVSDLSMWRMYSSNVTRTSLAGLRGVGYARLSSSTGMVRTPAVWRAYPAKPG
jgi:hypothetical protein